jgi:hypothetical protein
VPNRVKNYSCNEKDRVVEKESESEVKNRQQSCIQWMPEVAESTSVTEYAPAGFRRQ